MRGCIAWLCGSGSLWERSEGKRLGYLGPGALAQVVPVAACCAFLCECPSTDNIYKPIEMHHTMLSLTHHQIGPRLEHSLLPRELKKRQILHPLLCLRINHKDLAGRRNNTPRLLTKQKVHLHLFNLLHLLRDRQRIKDIHQIINHDFLGVRPAVVQDRVFAVFEEVVRGEDFGLLLEELFEDEGREFY